MRLILILVAMIAAVIFAVQNATPVAVRIFSWRLEASLAVIVVVCLAVGAVVTALSIMPGLYRRRSSERRLRTKVADLEAEHAHENLSTPRSSDSGSR